MSSEDNINESNYDEKSLAEKFLNNLSDIDNHNENKNGSLLSRFRIDNLIYVIKKGLHLLDINTPIQYALDVGCGDGYMCQILIDENLAENAIGIDKSIQMIEYAKLKCQNKNYKDNQLKYLVIDVIEDLKKSFDKKFQLTIQSYMLCHAENVDQLFQIISNIYQITNGIFAGLLPNSSYDPTNNNHKLLKYRMRKIFKKKIDGEKYYFSMGVGTNSEITLIDHWYSLDTYERLFKQAGFKYFQWVPLIIDQNRMNQEEQDYLADFLDSQNSIGFIASTTDI